MPRRRQKLNLNQSIPRTIEQHREFLVVIDHLFDDFFYYYVTDLEYTIYDSNYAFSEDEARTEAHALIRDIRNQDEPHAEEIQVIQNGPLVARIFKVTGSATFGYYWRLLPANAPVDHHTTIATGIAKSQEDATIQATAALHFYTGGAPS